MLGEPLILASGSPRRRELLGELGLDFEVKTVAVQELGGLSAPHLAPADLALANARLKAEAVAGKNPGRWVLGADTIVALESSIYGKPASLDEAREFLRALSGKTHRVVTACVLRSPGAGEDFFVEETAVAFHRLTEEKIDRYLAAVDVMDKAGAYALQERGDWIVAGIDGSRSNVVGLPLEKLAELLRSRGLLNGP
jgi:septum formation protein